MTRPVYRSRGYDDALPDVWVRLEVLGRLERAAATLPVGLNLVVLDGWRPLTLQQALYTEFRNQVQATQPNASDAEIERRTLQYAAFPSDDPQAPSPHLTGGAVDVCLADHNGDTLPMGTAFDEMCPASWTEAPVAQIYARRRRCLYCAMTSAGFTNIPSEWWHYDFGNWIWAFYKKTGAAKYGPIHGLPHA
ncbi:MAG: M15 family metallopeptidase [Pseudomonadota bacterium]